MPSMFRRREGPREVRTTGGSTQRPAFEVDVVQQNAIHPEQRRSQSDRPIDRLNSQRNGHGADIETRSRESRQGTERGSVRSGRDDVTVMSYPELWIGGDSAAGDVESIGRSIEQKNTSGL